MFALCAMAMASLAHAEWHEASSDHFVIYADQSPEQLRTFAERLERYHAGLEIFLNSPRPKPSPSSRVTIYMVNTDRAIRKLAGDGNAFTAGFYIPRAGGSVAFVPEHLIGGGDSMDTYRTLFHEYAHHFLLGSSAVSYPLWFSEGFAEFISTVRFERDGGLGMGLPAKHRGYELLAAKPVPIGRLLDTTEYLKTRTTAYDEFYGRSWLLFHFLKASGARKGQLAAYLNALQKGQSEVEAAQAAFGDLSVLDKELDRYMRSSRWNYYPVPAAKLPVGNIALRKLDKGEADAIPIIMRSKRGVDEVTAKQILSDARAIAGRYPNHPSVLSALAEAEFDAGNNDAAIAAADRTLAVAPANINALLHKGYALARMMTDAENPAKAAAEVRAQFLKVNALENDHPIPLVRYYTSFQESGRNPTRNAIEGLEWALTLAPYDQSLRMMVAAQQVKDKRFLEAEDTLLPLAHSPHTSALTEAAEEMLVLVRDSRATPATAREQYESPGTTPK